MFQCFLMFVGALIYVQMMRWIMGRRRANINVAVALGVLWLASDAQAQFGGPTDPGNYSTTVQAEVQWTWPAAGSIEAGSGLGVRIVGDHPVVSGYNGTNGPTSLNVPAGAQMAVMWRANITRPVWQTSQGWPDPFANSYAPTAVVPLLNYGNYWYGTAQVYRDIRVQTPMNASETGIYLLPRVLGKLWVYVPSDGSYVTIGITGPEAEFSAKTFYPLDTTGQAGSGMFNYLNPGFGLNYCLDASLLAGGKMDLETFGGRQGFGGIRLTGLKPATQGAVPATQPGEEEDEHGGIFKAVKKMAEKAKDPGDAGSLPTALGSPSLLTACYTADQMRIKLVTGINKLPGVAMEARVIGGVPDQGIWQNPTYDVFLLQVAERMADLETRFGGLIALLRLLGTAMCSGGLFIFMLKNLYWCVGARESDKVAPPILSPGR